MRKFVIEAIVDNMIGPDKRVHEVVKDFVDSIHRLEDLYKKLFLVFENLPTELETGENNGPGEILKHYRSVADIHTALINSYHDLLTSYYSFRKCAEGNEAVKAEFGKIPGSFSEISAQLKSIIDENATYLSSLEKLLEETVETDA